MVNKKTISLFLFFSFMLLSIPGIMAQLKFIIEDFEGIDYGPGDLKPNGIFIYGNTKANVDGTLSNHESYSGERSIKINKEGGLTYGGWGKGISVNIELDVNTDFLNFYVYSGTSNNISTLKIELQDDDNGDHIFHKDHDDMWTSKNKIEAKNGWQLISIPLSSFKDNNEGGDDGFNISYKNGKLLSLIFSFDETAKSNQVWSFDFISISQGKLPTGKSIFSAPPSQSSDFCSLGLWSKEGNSANYTDIAVNFENSFKYGSDKKLAVIHFFQPFSFDGGNTQNAYPTVDRINKVIAAGYIPLVTLEDHFVNTKPHIKQPNLYSIVEGHFDSFFKDWATQMKQAKGTILLRILHEFNGDWYPWCTINNDKNPEMVVKAYRHIHNIFKAQNVTNVKFVWCPNSMSIPQEKWNFIMDAYPGDQYVDYVGLDIYNGAGKGIPLWRSFRKEGIENYFIINQRLSHLPILICEAASRERESYESKTSQNKAEWIRQMSDALSTDMSKIKLLVWFNEKGTFKITSSESSQHSYLTNILKNDYFRSGSEPLLQFMKR
jgi:beta-mannanase